MTIRFFSNTHSSLNAKFFITPALLLTMSACGGGSSGSGNELVSDPATITSAGREADLNQGMLNLNGETTEITIADDLDLEIRSGSTTAIFEADRASIGLGNFAGRSTDGNSVAYWAADSSKVDNALYDYTSFGIWVTSSRDLFFGVPVEDAGAFFDIQMTDAASVPQTGSAVYTGQTQAFLIENGTLTDNLYGDGALTADFAGKSVSGGFDLSSTNAGDWGTIDFDNLTINGAEISGMGTSSRGHSGSVDARFAGPGAEEIGGIYGLSDGNSEIVGAFGVLQIEPAADPAP